LRTNASSKGARANIYESSINDGDADVVPLISGGGGANMSMRGKSDDGTALISPFNKNSVLASFNLRTNLTELFSKVS
jgi:hypothetical protein